MLRFIPRVTYHSVLVVCAAHFFMWTHHGWFIPSPIGAPWIVSRFELLCTILYIFFPTLQDTNGLRSIVFFRRGRWHDLSLHNCFLCKLKKHLFQSKWPVFSHHYPLSQVVSVCTIPKLQVISPHLDYWLTQWKNKLHKLLWINQSKWGQTTCRNPTNPQQWRLDCLL